MTTEHRPRRRLREALRGVSERREPAAALLAPAAIGQVRRVAVLPGAFNPPTLAHLALARAALGKGFDAVLFSLGTQTIDKPEGGVALEDRAFLLEKMAANDAAFGVLLHNRGLYAEQAEAVARLFPDAELTFVIGMDKVPQIFDARYYANLNDSLSSLFARARLLVAARGGFENEALQAILARPPASRFADRIDWLEMDSCWHQVSASAIRQRLGRGESVAEWLAPEVAEFLAETGLFLNTERR